MTAALYVDVERGPYAGILGSDQCWGVDRDAKRYSGPGPVVAHPPCGPWGRLAHLCKYQDPECGIRAVEQVRAFGGVLEHPRDSRLWAECGLPRPQDPPFLIRPDEFTIQIDQCRWGHPCKKTTWLFFAGIDPAALPPLPPWREPTHCIDDGAARRDGRPSRFKRLPHKEAHLTPGPFAEWLLAAVGYVPSGIPTHVIDTNAKHKNQGTGQPHLAKTRRHLTPPAFARWLIESVSG